MPFEIELTQLARDHLTAIRAFDRSRIVDEIKEQLAYQPDVETRNRKRLENITPEFEHEPPVWELRVGNYRAYYDVSTEMNTVTVRAVREKKQGQTTEDLIHDQDDD